jgi:ABC-type phosphate transport system substrate-binding protein
MNSHSVRRLTSACAISVATVAALFTPGVASAKVKLNPKCEGVSITSQGSSLQAGAQQKLWGPGFNSLTATKSKFACATSPNTPTITYTKTSSGGGLNSWGAETGTPEKTTEGTTVDANIGFGPINAFFGTDEPPNATQIKNIQNSELVAKPIETIPVTQESVAIIVHLPVGCSATSEVEDAANRLVFTDEDLGNVYDGADTKFSQITGGGDAIHGTIDEPAEGEKPASPQNGEPCGNALIKPVVRQDQSGTTHIVKRFLSEINGASFATASGSHTWSELSEGSLNTTWPTAAGVTLSGGEGGSKLASKVLATPGGVGYINLFEAREKGFAPATATTFWVELQNTLKTKGTGTKAKTTITYEDPSTNHDEGTTKGSANCSKTVYDTGAETGTPDNTTLPWNAVTASTTQKSSYALCGLTYDVALEEYGQVPSEATEKEATTVKTYLQFVVDKNGGQKLLEGNDYFPLPKEVDAKSVTGAASILF